MADLLDEAVLKLVSLTLRFVQFALSIVIVSCIGEFIANLSDENLAVPDSHAAVVAISGVTAAWSAVALLTTCCAGKIMLEIETTLDLICTLLSIAEAVLLRDDVLSSAAEFAAHYGLPAMNSILWNNRSLARTSFAVVIVNM